MFVGQFGDDPSALSYLNARYYDGSRGQFVSQDPMFLGLGDPKVLGQLTQERQEKVLTDPQALNSYAYARGNPLRYSDPQGLLYGEVSASGSLWPLPVSGATGLRFKLERC